MFLLNRRQFLRVSASLAGAFTFSRLTAHDQPVRFGIITDSHYADRDRRAHATSGIPLAKQKRL
jgi:hypothetical protein